MNGVKFLGVPEIAELIGVSRQRADQLSKQDDFPAPAQVFGSAQRRRRLWSMMEVQAWDEARKEKMRS